MSYEISNLYTIIVIIHDIILCNFRNIVFHTTQVRSVHIER